MISKYRNKELVWTDLESPQEPEINYVLEEYNIPSIIREEMDTSLNSDIIRLYNGYIYASLSFPQLTLNKNIENKLIFIASDNYVISIHNEPIRALSAFLKEMELDTIKNEKIDISDNKLLFANLLKSLYVNSHREIISNNTKINNLKEQIIEKNKKIKFLKKLITSLLIIIILISIYAIIYI